MIRGRVVGGSRLATALQGMERDLARALDRAVGKGANAVAGQARRNVTGGGPGHLNVRTNRLRNSLQARKLATARWAVGTDVIYGPIHEFGGEIRPKTKKWLRFPIREGKALVTSPNIVAWVTTKLVKMPKRAYLYPALDANRDKITRLIRDAIQDALDKRLGVGAK